MPLSPSLYSSHRARRIRRSLFRRPHQRHSRHPRIRRPLPRSRLHRPQHPRGLLVRSRSGARGNPADPAGAHSDAVKPESVRVRHRDEQSAAEIPRCDEGRDLYDLHYDRWAGRAHY